MPDGEYLIESLTYMGISMDKYKTSLLGQALKKVFKGEMTVENSVNTAKKEIETVFLKTETPFATDTDNGFYGDVIGQCPICKRDVIKGRYGYGCTGYKDGCNFRISGIICKRVISKKSAKMLLENKITDEIQGFISKAGKPFNARLALEDSKTVFKF